MIRSPLLVLSCFLLSPLALAQDWQEPDSNEVEQAEPYGQDPAGRSADPYAQPSSADPYAQPDLADPYARPQSADPYAAPRTVTEPQPALTGTPTQPTLTPEQKLDRDEPSNNAREAITNGQFVQGRPRQGAFLAGPGSFDFVLHHTLMGAAGGFAVTAIPGHFDFTRVDSRTAMLLGTLVGAGLGFATSSLYQFNNWIDKPASHYGVVNSVVASLFLTGVMDTFSNDPLVLATTALIGAELGGWLTMVLGTGSLSAARGLMLTTGASWGLIYASLLVATLATSGTEFDGAGSFLPALMMAPGLGLGAMALAAMRYEPSVNQLLRANALGGAVGGGVLLLTALAAGGFGSPLPYVLGLVSSAAAMSLVSMLWAEPGGSEGVTVTYTGSRQPVGPYSNPWW